MTFGELLRELRDKRKMTLRQLGERAGLDYVMLNKVELGLRMPPPLEGIFALADVLNSAKPLTDEQMVKLLDLAAEENGQAGARFSRDEVQRLKTSEAAQLFFTRRTKPEDR